MVFFLSVLSVLSVSLCSISLDYARRLTAGRCSVENSNRRERSSRNSGRNTNRREASSRRNSGRNSTNSSLVGSRSRSDSRGGGVGERSGSESGGRRDFERLSRRLAELAAIDAREDDWDTERCKVHEKRAQARAQ